MTICKVCHVSLTMAVKNIAKENLSQVLEAAKMTRKIIERGVRSSSGECRALYRKYLSRAKTRGFTSVKDRYENDLVYREQMMSQGWDDLSISTIDFIANSDPQPNQGRTKEQILKYSGWFDGYEEDPKGKPLTKAHTAPCQHVANLRRRQEKAWWTKFREDVESKEAHDQDLQSRWVTGANQPSGSRWGAGAEGSRNEVKSEKWKPYVKGEYKANEYPSRGTGASSSSSGYPERSGKGKGDKNKSKDETEEYKEEESGKGYGKNYGFSKGKCYDYGRYEAYRRRY